MPKLPYESSQSIITKRPSGFKIRFASKNRIFGRRLKQHIGDEHQIQTPFRNFGTAGFFHIAPNTSRLKFLTARLLAKVAPVNLFALHWRKLCPTFHAFRQRQRVSANTSAKIRHRHPLFYFKIIKIIFRSIKHLKIILQARIIWYNQVVNNF